MGKILIQNFIDVEKASLLLKASVRKYKKFNKNKVYTPKELEPYDALSSRFERIIDMTTNRLFKSLELYFYSDNSESFRDRVLRMNKLGIISDVDEWFDAKILRNKIAHAYIPEEISDIYIEIINFSSTIFLTIQNIKKILLHRNLYPKS